MKRYILSLMVLAILATFSGCGYTTGSVISSRYRTVFVEPFENKTDYMNAVNRQIYVPQLESKVHDALIDRFMFDGNLKIAEQGNSDLVMKGKVLAYTRDELRLNANEDVKESRVTVTVELTLWDPVNEKVVWHEPSFSGDTTYYTTGPNAKTDDQATQDAVNDLARRAVARTIEDW